MGIACILQTKWRDYLRSDIRESLRMAMGESSQEEGPSWCGRCGDSGRTGVVEPAAEQSEEDYERKQKEVQAKALNKFKRMHSRQQRRMAIEEANQEATPLC